MCSMSWASASCAEATRTACPGSAFAARCWRRIFLTWLTLSLLPKVLPLLWVLVRLRRRGFQILFAIRVRLDVRHVASPCWLREMKRLRKRAFLWSRYTISLDGRWEPDSKNPARRGAELSMHDRRKIGHACNFRKHA